MKSKTFLRRCIAIMLCMAIVLSLGGGYLLADSFQEQPAAENVEVQPEEGTETSDEQPDAEETVEIDVSDAAEEGEKTDGEASEPPSAESSDTEDTSPEEDTAVEEGNAEPSEEEAAKPEVTEEENFNQEMTLTKTVKGVNEENCKVEIHIPEGAFKAKAEQVGCEVTAVTTGEKDTIKKLMEEKVAADHKLSGYVMYRVTFFVNGTETEPLKSVDVEFRGTGLQVAAKTQANVFYFASAGSEDGIQKDSLIELPQREEKLKELSSATGKTREQLEEEYDFSEVTVKEETLEVLELEAQRNRIYGCYIIEEKASEPVEEPVKESAEPETAVSIAEEGKVTVSQQYGKLSATYSGTATEYGYVWYRSINGGEFIAQVSTAYTGPTGTNLGKDISEDGRELYIALNGGALGYREGGVTNNEVQYYAAVYNLEDLDDGLPKEGAAALTTSSIYQVTSYYELQNGSFETPVNSSYMVQYSNANYAARGGVWQTTGVGSGSHKNQDIEIVSTTAWNGYFKNDYKWYGEGVAADGVQFAELNCEADGALYQDVLTTPGETLNYQLSHRARGVKQDSTPETDTMYVVMMSTEMAVSQNVTTQAKVQDIIDNRSQYPGATVVQYSSDDQAWHTHQGSYTVLASGQYSTRFFFVAGKTASKDNTVGNFLDNIRFTRDKLSPVEGTASVNFTKTISGFEHVSDADEVAQGLRFSIGKTTLQYEDLIWSWADGIYSGSTTISVAQQDCGNLDVEETGTLDADGYMRSSSLFINNSISGSGTSGKAEVRVGKTVSIEFKNHYTKSGGSGSDSNKNIMTHEKYIKKNADGTYNITLNASGSIGSQVNKAKVDIVLVVDTSGSMANSSKLTNTKAAINALIAAFNEKNATVEARYKLVTFASSATLQTMNWVTGNTLSNQYVSQLGANGGTNYDKGLEYGATAISSAGSGARKIVIFLTDGQPTYYGNKQGLGDDTSKNTLSAAITSAGKIKCDDFYAVGIGLPSQIKIYNSDYNRNKVVETVSGLEILNRVKTATSATVKSAWNLQNSSELTNKFKDIAGQTLNFACSKVVISDILSQYVEVTKGTKIKVNIAKKNADGSFTDIAGKGREFALDEVSGEKSGTVYEENTAIGKVTYLADTKTAKLTFNSDYTLKEGYYYYLMITNVTPTEEAFKHYGTKGYPSVGSDYTDEGKDGYIAATDGTSSNKEGFYSNANASISYEWKGTAYEESYPNPVIQVETITVKKEWEGIEHPTDTVLVQLLDKEGKAVPGQILKLSVQNQYTGKVIVEQASNYSGIRELTEVAKGTEGAIHFENKYYAMVESDGVLSLSDYNYKVTYTSEEMDNKIVYKVTNTKNSEKIRVLKKQSGSGTSATYLEGAEFTLKDRAGEFVTIGTNTTGTYTSTREGLVLEGKIDYGKYILTEVKSPAGYMLLERPVTITVNENGITVDNKNGEKVTCSKDSKDIYVISVTNEMLYELPSAGGMGIFWYTIGGVMLMMTAALILYKKKCEELLDS